MTKKASTWRGSNSDLSVATESQNQSKLKYLRHRRGLVSPARDQTQSILLKSIQRITPSANEAWIRVEVERAHFFQARASPSLWKLPSSLLRAQAFP